jgi:hypothetical protein
MGGALIDVIHLLPLETLRPRQLLDVSVLLRSKQQQCTQRSRVMLGQLCPLYIPIPTLPKRIAILLKFLNWTFLVLTAT